MSPTRRDLLRGLGASIALPFLPSLGSVARAEDATPLRFVLWYAPNGMPMDRWTPSTLGTGWTPTSLLAPLERHRQKLTVVSGLSSGTTPAWEPHLSAGVHFACGRSEPPHALPAETACVSVDQVAAQTLGASTRFPSLQLASEGPALCAEAAAGQIPDCSPYWTLSWADRDTPLLPTNSPQALFDRLFGSTGGTAAERARRARHDRAILDSVMADIAAVEAKLGTADRTLLDQYLTGIEELERRIALDAAGDPGTCVPDAEALGTRLAAAEGIGDHVDVMGELMTLALSCDQTRVVSYMLGNLRSERPYPHLGISDSHHFLSHHGGDTDKIDAIETIGRWEVERFAAFLDRLDATPDGDGTLLDHTVVLFASALGDPHFHDPSPLPVVVAGGPFTHGHHRMFEGASLSRLHLTLLRAVGAPVPYFGDDGTVELDLG